MNFLLLLSLGAAVCLSASFVSAKPTICYHGQTYWCRNITTAAECNAVRHCIHSVWEQEIPIEMDTSSVCQTCIDMVKMARDQLRSNETEEELREVLEGTCKVIPEKLARKECDKMMDALGTYIVDTLSSQMDPAVVCSVAGLCYNEKFKNVKVVRPLTCENCNGLMKVVERKMESASSENIRSVLKNVCNKLGSFKPVCQSLLAEHIDSVDALARNYVKAEPICDLAGVCTEKYHSHRSPQIFTLPQDVEVIGATGNDDLPCELCEQLVKHLKDTLIANTTETEFKMILEGLCKMSSMKDKCSAFIDDYYQAIYSFLVHELDGKVLCTELKLCSNSSQTHITSATAAQTLQLPLERISTIGMSQAIPAPVSKGNEMFCAICEYSLHVLQQEMTLPSNERSITDFLERLCYDVPLSVIKGSCTSFVDSYSAQLIAILSIEVDPSTVCPSIGVCHKELQLVESEEKPSCPLCLLAMDKALGKVHNKSEEGIRDVLDDLCLRDEFPTPLLIECVQFVNKFRGPVTDMIIADFNSQEACVYVDLCSPPEENSTPQPKTGTPLLVHPGDVETNEIHEDTDSVQDPLFCSLCVIAVEEAEHVLTNNKTDEEIVDFFLSICSLLPENKRDGCRRNILDNRNLILNLIKRSTPRVVCSVLCSLPLQKVTAVDNTQKCVMCEVLMDFLKAILTNEEVDEDINKNLFKACQRFPLRDIRTCESLVEQLGPQLESILRTVPVGPLVCRRTHVCPKDRIAQELHLLGSDLGPGCYSGAEYWCATSGNAVECDKVEYCQRNVWLSEKPKGRKLKGSDIM